MEGLVNSTPIIFIGTYGASPWMMWIYISRLIYIVPPSIEQNLSWQMFKLIIWLKRFLCKRFQMFRMKVSKAQNLHVIQCVEDLEWAGSELWYNEWLRYRFIAVTVNPSLFDPQLQRYHNKCTCSYKMEEIH